MRWGVVFSITLEGKLVQQTQLKKKKSNTKNPTLILSHNYHIMLA
jgi:hypothetical protein